MLATLSTVATKNESGAGHYYPMPDEALRYVKTPVWLLYFTLYEFTRAVRFAIGREARFAPLYLAEARLQVRAPRP